MREPDLTITKSIVRHIEWRYHFVKLERVISSWTLSETLFVFTRRN